MLDVFDKLKLKLKIIIRKSIFP